MDRYSGEMEHNEPPRDPNEWTDEQWLEWLKATDIDAGLIDESTSTVMQRIVQSSPGQVLGQAMLGMANAIYGRRDDDIVIVVEGNGETGDDEPFAVQLDREHPERSSVRFKPNSTPSM